MRKVDFDPYQNFNKIETKNGEISVKLDESGYIDATFKIFKENNEVIGQLKYKDFDMIFTEKELWMISDVISLIKMLK